MCKKETRIFTLDEIKIAFWGYFHGRGDVFFKPNCYGDEEVESQQSTQSHWENFIDDLNGAQHKAD
ncbi:hypothetical protein [Burkholderia sp. BCC0405]|uniref:hypothetical protein n=1 Tax=Burkholderia sp. BCC0405 TaxID=2676298 RepID=UPI001588A1FF|nr:hypothetical protein [Burkholderia sp. BCC0405]